MALFINKWECIFLPVAKTSAELCLATSPGVKDLFFINSIINLILGTEPCRGKRVCASCTTGNRAVLRFTPRRVRGGSHLGTGASGEAGSPRYPELRLSSPPARDPPRPLATSPRATLAPWGWGRPRAGGFAREGRCQQRCQHPSLLVAWGVGHRSPRTPHFPTCLLRVLPPGLTPLHHPLGCGQSHHGGRDPQAPSASPGIRSLGERLLGAPWFAAHRGTRVGLVSAGCLFLPLFLILLSSRKLVLVAVPARLQRPPQPHSQRAVGARCRSRALPARSRSRAPVFW